MRVKITGLSRAGFTILEVVVAMLLVTGVGAAVFTSFRSASRIGNDAKSLPNIYWMQGSWFNVLDEYVRIDTWRAGGPPFNQLFGGPVSISSYMGTELLYTGTRSTDPVYLGGVEAYRRVSMVWTNTPQ